MEGFKCSILGVDLNKGVNRPPVHGKREIVLLINTIRVLGI